VINNMSKHVIQALVCDFDGLLCDTEGALVATAREIFTAHGASFPIDRWLLNVGTAGPEDFWVPWLIEGADRHIDTDAVLIEFRARNHARVLQLEPNPGVLALLDLADSHDIPLAIASSSSTSWVEPLTKNLGIFERFTHVVCREHAPRGKPAPDLYIEAANQLRCEPSKMIAFEDSHNGSLAAIRANMSCVVVPNELTASQDFSHASATVTSLNEIRDLDHLQQLVGFNM
jgi:HAD superfamily hydrolase (TIGR01509 family)